MRKTTTIIAIIFFVAGFLVGAAYFKYYPDMVKEKKIVAYKKAMFNSLVCQYSCPLTMQKIMNVSMEAPDEACVLKCTEKFLAMNITAKDITNEDLLKDNLMNDMQFVIQDCRRSSTIVANSSVDNLNVKVNSTAFFGCTSVQLSNIKGKYSYLK